MTILRIGQGFDTHAFDSPESQRPMWLCCLYWPDITGLAGHSDGDVAAHALCDALLGAAGLGDLGSNFGVDRPEFKNASGETFLGAVRTMLSEDGWSVINATVSVIGNEPRMGPRYEECRARLSDLVGAPVAVSATTTDHLGALGRGEGLAAMATVLLERS
ncbi:MAG: 2-C-methyl-D-erythritol 2,4-cyclodiphosphate synthase [Actinomycetaceae bacterium]|nr:2-C-methyl-D-erythritol 2,4-cyclodiphosphate synthase [Actinomycetaceae bacterium]